MPTQDREQMLAEQRAAMPIEERQVVALEQIADEMTRVRVELVNIRAAVQVMGRR